MPQLSKASLDAILTASRVLVAVSAQSMTAVEDQVTVPGLRTLVVLAGRKTLDLRSLAEALGVHPSNASRLCERLVADGLVRRQEDPLDRRHLVLSLTGDGQKIVDVVTRTRRAAIRKIVQRMSPVRAQLLAEVLEDFAAAAGEPEASDLWAMAWASVLTVPVRARSTFRVMAGTESARFIRNSDGAPS